MEFESLERAAIDNLSFSQCSLVSGVLRGQGDGGGERRMMPPPDDGSVMCEEEADDGREGEETRDLDKTLTPSQSDVRETEVVGEAAGQSLAAGLVFSDEEEWESFSHGSPLPDQPRHQDGKDTPSPVKNEPHIISSTPLSTTPPPQPQPQLTQADPSQFPPSGNNAEPPPPPSALAARLFPALRRERERVLLQQKQERLPQPSSNETPPTVATPPRYPSEPELRDKLCELETEIERFRVMNSRLEQQRKEKEQVRVVCVLLYWHCVLFCLLVES